LKRPCRRRNSKRLWKICITERNYTWELTDLPKGARPIGIKWMYKKKTNVEGIVEQYKARPMVKGYK